MNRHQRDQLFSDQPIPDHQAAREAITRRRLAAVETSLDDEQLSDAWVSGLTSLRERYTRQLPKPTARAYRDDRFYRG